MTIDHTIAAGNTDSAGIVRIPDLLEGGHIIEVVARGHQAYFDNFNSGANVQQPIQLELLPIPASDTTKATGQKTDLKFVGFQCESSAPQFSYREHLSLVTIVRGLWPHTRQRGSRTKCPPIDGPRSPR